MAIQTLRMLLYAITSRILLAKTEEECAEKLIALAAQWAAHGVNYIQIRERDLSAADLLNLASKIVQAVHRTSSPTGMPTYILINSAAETALLIALESGADGVHLPSGLNANQLETTVDQIHKSWQAARSLTSPPVISVSCHSAAEVRAARAAGANLALFAPVFEKALRGDPALPGQGLEPLTEACRAAREAGEQAKIAVIALGGVTLENAAQCIAAGADGIAAIRLFLNPEAERSWEKLSQASESR